MTIRKVTKLKHIDIDDIPPLSRDEIDEVVTGKPAKSKKKLAKATNGTGRIRKPAEGTTPRVIDGYVTLPQLAQELSVQGQLVRLWLKKADIKKPGKKWAWKDGSRDLARVRKIVGLNT